MFHRSDKFLLEMVENNKIISTLTIKVKLREKKLAIIIATITKQQLLSWSKFS